MQITEQSGSRRGSAVLLALLVSLLLGSGPAAAFPQSRSAAAGQSTGGKASAVVRSIKRDVAGDADRDDPSLHLGRGAVVETRSLALRPVVQGVVPAPAPRAAARPTAYRARAPPAA